MRKELKTGPATAATTLAEVKVSSFINTTKHDTDISDLIEPMTLIVENYLGRKLIDQSWYIYLNSYELFDRLAAYDVLSLDGLNVSAITEMLSYDTANASTAIVSSTYRLQGNETTPTSNLVFNENTTPLTGGTRYVDSYRIEVVAGYGAAIANIPTPVHRALEELIAYHALHKNVISDSDKHKIPYKFEAMLFPYKSFENVV
jgi:uncharacterized phiE125 gp8 family phage protein